MLLSCTRHPANQQIRCRPISGTFGYRKNAACGSDNSFRLFRQEDVSPADYATSRCFYRVLAIRRTSKSAVGPSPALSAIGKTLRAVLTTASCPSFKKMSVRQTTQHPGVFFVYFHPANQQIRCRSISGIFGYRKNAACGSDNSFRPFIKKTSVQQTKQHPGVFFVYSPSGEPTDPLSAHLRHFRLSEKHCVRF